MLQEYVDAAMAYAVIHEPGEDGLYVGDFPDYPDVPAASDAAAEGCRSKLKQNFEEWILFRTSRHLDLPVIGGHTISYQEIRNRPRLLERLHNIERDVQALAGDVDRARAVNPAWKKLGAAVKKANEYWALFSFAGALIVVAFVLLRFGVGPFDEYMKIQTNREVSAVYSRMGDRMLERGEYKLAKVQYKAALAIYPNNVAALEGTFKSQLLDPIEGEKYVRKNILDTRLESLKRFGGSEYLIDFYKGIKRREEGAYDLARESLLAAVEKKPQLMWARLYLGDIALEDSGKFDVKEALEQFKLADKIPGDGAAGERHEDELPKYFLGKSYLLLGDLRRAKELLLRSIEISPRVDAAYALGETFRYQGDFENAVGQHRYAAGTVADDKNVVEDFLEERTLCNFMPLKPGDVETIRRWEPAYGFNDFRILLHYALSLDYVLARNFEGADAEWKAARDLDTNHRFDDYAQNRVASMLGFLAPTDFHDASLKDPKRLAVRLRFGCDPVSLLLMSSLSPETRAKLDAYDFTEEVPEDLRAALVRDLQRLLKDPSLSAPGRFPQERLTDKTRELLRRPPAGEGLSGLNRKLLEESYPAEIVKHLDEEQVGWLNKQNQAPKR